jgi:hypothetical protein
LYQVLVTSISRRLLSGSSASVMSSRHGGDQSVPIRLPLRRTSAMFITSPRSSDKRLPAAEKPLGNSNARR